MPTIKVNNATLYYEDSAPNSDKPVMFFAHGLLWGTYLYDKQVAYFKKDYRCIAFDFRGQGKSQITKSGYDMDTLAADAIALLEALHIKQCHFVGLSMGGFVAQRVAINRPDLLQTLILMETSADIEDQKKISSYRWFIRGTRLIGIKSIANRVMPIMFGDTFRNDKTRKAEYKKWLNHLKANRKHGIIRATQGVINRQAVYDKLNQINTPTLVLVGDEDTPTPYAKAARIHFAIQGSKLAIIQGAGHTSTIEEPEQVNAAIETFLKLTLTQPTND